LTKIQIGLPKIQNFMPKKEINRLKVVLVEQKRTNKWLSKQMGKNISTISQWCTNERQPSLETFVEIAIVLDVDIKDLLNSTKL